MQQRLIEDVAYLRDWFQENEICFIIPYIEENFYEASWNHQYNYMLKHLFFTKKIIENDLMNNAEKQLKLLNMMAYGKSKIVTIIGARDSGKTATSGWIMQELHERNLHKKIYWVKKGATRPKGFPKYINVVDDIDDVPNDSFAVIDETAIKYKAREHWSDINKDFISRLVILRHKGISVVLLTQHIKLIDIGIRRLSDIMIYKFGAKIMRDDEKIDSDIVLARERLKPKEKEECLIEAGNQLFKFSHGLPEWWNDYISKAYADFNPELETKLSKAERLRLARDREDREFQKEKELELAKIEKMAEFGMRPIIERKRSQKLDI